MVFLCGVTNIFFKKSNSSEYNIKGHVAKYHADQEPPDLKPNGPGDVNNDGKIDQDDRQLIVDHINGTIQLSEDQMRNADLNRDRNIDNGDLEVLDRFLAENQGPPPQEVVLTAVTITKQPNKTQYVVGQNFDSTGMVVEATYSDGNKNTVTDYQIANGNNLKENQTSVNISYGGITVSQSITVVAKAVSKIEVTKNPTKVQYIQNKDTLDLTGGTIKATFNDGSTDNVSMTDSSVTTSGFSNKTLGKNTVTVKYGSKSTTFDVTIIANSVTALTITKQPTKTQYIEGQNFDSTGMVVQATYKDGSKQTITDYEVKNGTKLTKNQVEVLISFEEKTVSQAITVIAKVATKIEINKKPSKTKYIQNVEKLNLTDGSIKATFNDNSVKTIEMSDDSVKVSGFNNKNLGENTITVEYQSKTATFDVTIIANSVTVLTITKQASKTEYIEGQNFDSTGIEVEATYRDESKKIIDNYEIRDGENLKRDQTEVIVFFEGIYTSQPITVKEKVATKIEIDKKPIKDIYIQNIDNLNLTDGTIKVAYNDDSVETISMSDDSVKTSGFSNEKLGENTVTVEYQGQTATFDVTIVKNDVATLTITNRPNKTEYIEGQKFDNTGMVIEATYRDNSKQEIDNYEIKNGDNLNKDQKEVVIVFEGVPTSQPISVKEKEVTEIEIYSRPTKNQYIQNVEELNLSGGSINAIYNDDSVERISMTDNSVKVYGFNNKNPGVNTVTVEYQGRTASFDVTIVEGQNSDNSNNNNSRGNNNDSRGNNNDSSSANTQINYHNSKDNVAKSDQTISNNGLPYAGISKVLIFALILILVSAGIISYTRYKKLY